MLNGPEHVNERLLFHGTGGTNPAVIYDGVVGFDIRCTSDGNFYGRGVYFAESASYVEGAAFLGCLTLIWVCLALSSPVVTV